MNHRVSVYPQIKNEEYSTVSRSQNVIAINWGGSVYMTWQQFLRKYTIWFAANVVGEQQLKGVKPFEGTPFMGLDRTPVDLEQLQTAINTISSIPDVDYLDNLYYDYIKRDDVTDLGYYCKDNFPVPVTIEVRKL